MRTEQEIRQELDNCEFWHEQTEDQHSILRGLQSQRIAALKWVLGEE